MKGGFVSSGEGDAESTGCIAKGKWQMDLPTWSGVRAVSKLAPFVPAEVFEAEMRTWAQPEWQDVLSERREAQRKRRDEEQRCDDYYG